MKIGNLFDFKKRSKRNLMIFLTYLFGRSIITSPSRVEDTNVKDYYESYNFLNNIPRVEKIYSNFDDKMCNSLSRDENNSTTMIKVRGGSDSKPKDLRDAKELINKLLKQQRILDANVVPKINHILNTLDPSIRYRIIQFVTENEDVIKRIIISVWKQYNSPNEVVCIPETVFEISLSNRKVDLLYGGTHNLSIPNYRNSLGVPKCSNSDLLRSNLTNKANTIQNDFVLREQRAFEKWPNAKKSTHHKEMIPRFESPRLRYVKEGSSSFLDSDSILKTDSNSNKISKMGLQIDETEKYCKSGCVQAFPTPSAISNRPTGLSLVTGHKNKIPESRFQKILEKEPVKRDTLDLFLKEETPVQSNGLLDNGLSTNHNDLSFKDRIYERKTKERRASPWIPSEVLGNKYRYGHLQLEKKMPFHLDEFANYLIKYENNSVIKRELGNDVLKTLLKYRETQNFDLLDNLQTDQKSKIMIMSSECLLQNSKTNLFKNATLQYRDYAHIGFDETAPFFVGFEDNPIFNGEHHFFISGWKPSDAAVKKFKDEIETGSVLRDSSTTRGPNMGQSYLDKIISKEKRLKGLQYKQYLEQAHSEIPSVFSRLKLEEKIADRQKEKAKILIDQQKEQNYIFNQNEMKLFERYNKNKEATKEIQPQWEQEVNDKFQELIKEDPLFLNDIYKDGNEL